MCRGGRRGRVRLAGAAMPSAEDLEGHPLTDVGPANAVAPGQAVAFDVGGRRFLVCNASGSFYAVADRCSHAAWRLAGSEICGRELVCSLHGARFDLGTGAATRPPASKPLRTFSVRVRDGRLLVRVPPSVA